MNRLQGVLDGQLLPLTPHECWEVECQLNPRTLPFIEWLERLEKPRPSITPTPPLPPVIKPTPQIVAILQRRDPEAEKRRIRSDAAMLYPFGSAAFYTYIDKRSASEEPNLSNQENGGLSQDISSKEQRR